MKYEQTLKPDPALAKRVSDDAGDTLAIAHLLLDSHQPQRPTHHEAFCQAWLAIEKNIKSLWAYYGIALDDQRKWAEGIKNHYLGKLLPPLDPYVTSATKAEFENLKKYRAYKAEDRYVESKSGKKPSERISTETAKTTISLAERFATYIRVLIFG